MENFIEYIRPLYAWSTENTWIYQVFIIVFVSLLLSYVAGKLLDRLYARFQKTRNTWDDALAESARKPVRVLIWIIGIAFAAEIIHAKTDTPIFTAVDPIRDVGVIAVIAWFLLRLINNVQKNVLQQHATDDKPYDRTTLDAIGKLLRATVIITAFLVVLQTLGFSISGVLAFGGIGGIAVGFAAKDMLANFFGAMLVYLDRPFNVGDWIRSPDREIEGIVEDIGWRITTIRTFDKRPLYVPNSVFTSIIVENPRRMSHRRIYETIGIRYDDMDKMHAITDEVREMLQTHEEIDDSQTLMVYFNAFNASSIDFMVYTFTHTTVWTEFHRVKHEILLKIADIIASHGAEIAYPTRTLHVPERLLLARDGEGEAPDDDAAPVPAGGQ